MFDGQGRVRFLVWWFAFSSITALVGCAEDEDALEVDVVLRRYHAPLGDEEVVLVYPRFSGEACPCMSVSATPQGCSEISDIRHECECAATCFESARVERAGQVLGSNEDGVEYGPAVFRVSEPIEAGDELVIRGCGAERRVPLEPNDLDPLRGGTIVQRGHEFGVTWEPDPDAAYSTVTFSVGVGASSCATTETEYWFDRATTGPSQERAWDAGLLLQELEPHPTIVVNGVTVRRFTEDQIVTYFTLPRFVGSGRYEIDPAPYGLDLYWGSAGAPVERAWVEVLDDGAVSLDVEAGQFSLSTGPGFARASYRGVEVELPVLPLDSLFSDPFDVTRDRTLDYGDVTVQDPSEPERRTEGTLRLLPLRPLAMPVP